jgi:TonB family protein
MKNSRKPESFINQPLYPGGNKAMDEFIKKNMRYPEDALQHRIEGTVAVDIDIDVYGSVSSAKVKHGIGHGCDEEAIRLVNLLQFQKKKYKGLFVMFHKTINIHFRMHDAVAPVQFQYQYKEKAAGTSYQYTIKPE